jgi:hypothetical protein
MRVMKRKRKKKTRAKIEGAFWRLSGGGGVARRCS